CRPRSVRKQFALPLILERLEDRIVPTDYVWTGLGKTSDWKDPDNWDRQRDFPGKPKAVPDLDEAFFTKASVGALQQQPVLNDPIKLDNLKLDGFTGTLKLNNQLSTNNFSMDAGTIEGNFGGKDTLILGDPRSPSHSTIFTSLSVTFKN